MKLFVLASAFTVGAFLASTPACKSQSLTGVTSIRSTNLRLPALTLTGITLSTTGDGALVETSTALERLSVEIPTSSSQKTVIETFAGTSVREVTLFDPRTYNSSNPGTKASGQGPADGYPFICAASAPGQAPNVPGTYTDPGTGFTMTTGPGERPKNAWGDDADAAIVYGTPDPNPLASTVVSAGTQFARQPWLSSGYYTDPPLPDTGPLQVTPYPAGVPYPDCGG